VTQPLEQRTKWLKINDVTTGAAVTTRTTADFTFVGFYRPYGGAVTTWTHGSTIVHAGSGWYAWTYAVPPSAGDWFLEPVPNSANDLLTAPPVSDETENQDLDSIFANSTSLSGVLSGTAVLGNQIGIQIPVYRRRSFSITVRDSAGNLAPLNGYGNLRIGIRSTDGTSTKWFASQNSPWGFTITGDVSGTMTLTFPESSAGPIATMWVTLRTYALGDFVVPTANNGWIYQVTVAGTVAAGEPAWPTTEGNTVVSGTVTFTCLKKQVWTATTAKVLDEAIRPVADRISLTPAYFRCTVAGTTSGAEPTWASAPNPGDTLVDGTVTWKRMSDLYASLPTGQDVLEHRHEVIGDDLSDTSRTVTIIRSSPCQLFRREEGA
jgi:hypothetical protein